VGCDGDGGGNDEGFSERVNGEGDEIDIWGGVEEGEDEEDGKSFMRGYTCGYELACGVIDEGPSG